ncbi:AraC family transcriptional regulator [Pelagicoccus sp. NFK12]|uniref:AraC family transcriptional regulator n=1 Tax=Pelagicoccus enzymogenes TaxID=2773457 RepID=A0A927F4Z7_9BACT|nr:AraC family transcriptional regulator [Pelagicoccus enzymogenes]MBD5778547.1 AraC family transcriptional regulator [Pelagicoccus enzymogenes]
MKPKTVSKLGLEGGSGSGVAQGELPSFISEQVEDGDYFFLNVSDSKQAGFSLACGGVERCASSYRLSRSEFRFIGIEYVISGSARVVVAGREFVARRGTLFGYRPNESLLIESLGDAPLVKGFIDLYGSRVEALFSRTAMAEGQPIQYAGTSWMEHNFRQIVARAKDGGAQAIQFCELTAEGLLLHASDEGELNRNRLSNSYSSYLKCRSEIQSNFREVDTVAELASRVGYDQAYISRLFQRFDHEGPYAYLTRTKMNEAARLLMHESLSVKEVGWAIGFHDPAHFSRVFKKTFGVSPKHFVGSVMR